MIQIEASLTLNEMVDYVDSFARNGNEAAVVT